MSRSWTSHSSRGRVAGTAAVVAFLTCSCGIADAGEGGSAEWDEISDYSFTLEYFEGRCGGESRGAWSVTVHDDKTTEAKPLNLPARSRSWPEGAPTLEELYKEAQGVKRDGAYDVVRVKYDNGRYGRRPVSVYYLYHRGSERSESCDAFTDFRPLVASSN